MLFFSSGQISALNARLTNFGLRTPGYEERFAKRRSEVCPGRADVETYFDLMDIDDQQSFGIVDLTRRPPRSPYDPSLGGLMGLARLIDKGRAYNSGCLGAYWYGQDSGIDRRVLEFLGVSQEGFAAGLKECPDDESVLEWLGERLQRPEGEIDACNEGLQLFGPSNDQQRAFLQGIVARLDPSRTDVDTFFAMAVLDDEITFARQKAEV